MANLNSLNKKIEEVLAKLQKKKDRVLEDLKQINLDIKRAEKMLDTAKSRKDKFVYNGEPKKMPRFDADK